MSNDKNLIPILNEHAKTPLSRLQKQFNSRIKRINKAKEDVEKLTLFIKTAQTKIAEHIDPVTEQIMKHRAEILKKLDFWYDNKYFRKNEKQKIAEIVVEGAVDLISGHGMNELKELHDKYSEQTYDEFFAEEEGRMKEFLAEEIKEHMGFDFDFEGMDMTNPEEFLAKMAAMMEENAEKIIDFQKEKIEPKKSKKEKEKEKTKAQLAKEEKQKEELKNISKITKTIYNQLVKEYHPDREFDEKEREWKTRIMQRVTIAYKEDDLFELLRLKLELSTHKETEVKNLPEKELKYYNKILMEQINELEDKKFALKNPPPPHDHLEEYLRCKTVKTLEKKVLAKKKVLEDNITDLNFRLKYELNTKTNTRNYLKGYTLAAEQMDMGSLIDMLSASMFDDDDDFFA